MRRTFVLVAALLLTAGLAAAEAPDTATTAPVTLDQIFAAEEEGGCQLPDFSGMSDEEIAEAAIDAGFSVANAVQAQPPACPVSFACNSITNCAAGPTCSLTDLGQCCSSGGGQILCCIQGTIKVQRCPCVCTGMFCSLQCAASTNVRWRCA